MKEIKKSINLLRKYVPKFILLFNSWFYFFIGICFLFVPNSFEFFDFNIFLNGQNFLYFLLCIFIFIFLSFNKFTRHIKTIGSISFLIFFIISIYYLLGGDGMYLDKVLSFQQAFFILFLMFWLTSFSEDGFKTSKSLFYIFILLIILLVVLSGEQTISMAWKLFEGFYYLAFGVYLPYLHINYLYKKYIKKEKEELLLYEFIEKYKKK